MAVRKNRYSLTQGGYVAGQDRSFKSKRTCEFLSPDWVLTRPLPHTHDSHLSQNECRIVLEGECLCSKSCCLFPKILRELKYMVLVTICYLFLFSFAQASDTVSVSSNLEGLVQVSRFPRQHLPSGPQALIKWAGEHGYSPVTSYTSTPVANHFKIRLREPGKLKT